MLNDNPEFSVLLKECWNAFQFHGSSMFKVSRKLKELKSIIRTFSKDNYSCIENLVRESFEEFLQHKNVLFNSPTTHAAAEEWKAHTKWLLLAKADESFLYQRSRVNWLDKGDSDDNDVILETREEIMNHTVDFYENLLGGTSYQSSRPLWKK